MIIKAGLTVPVHQCIAAAADLARFDKRPGRRRQALAVGRRSLRFSGPRNS